MVQAFMGAAWLLLALFLWSGLGWAEQAGTSSGGTLTYGLHQTFHWGSLDLTTTVGLTEHLVLMNVNDTLLYMDRSGTFYPGLATRWEVSEDGLRYTFFLRDDVVFHDGTPFNAEAMRFNFERMRAEENAGKLSYSYIGPHYASSEAIDQHTLRVTFKKPHPLFLIQTTRFYLAPQSPTAVKKYGKEYYRHPVGTGPFIFVEWIPNESLTMVRNEQYRWASPMFQRQGPPALQKIVWKVIPEALVRASLLETGEIDVAEELAPQEFLRIQQHPDLQAVKILRSANPFMFYLNTARPPTNELAVRKAMQYALDKDTMIKTLFFGVYDPAWNMATPALWSYDPNLEKTYRYDPAQAKQILEAAGWQVNPRTGIREKNGQPLKLVDIPSLDPRIDEFAQAYFRDVGIDVEIRQMAGEAAVAAARRGEHHLYSGWWVTPDPQVMYTWAHSSGSGKGPNYIHVRFGDLDALLEQGLTVSPVRGEERKHLYQQVQRTIMEHALVIPLFNPYTLTGMRKEVQGLTYDAIGVYPWMYGASLAR